MAWEKRWCRWFSYKVKRRGKAVEKVFIGRGEAAQRVAERDAAARAKREQDRAELAEMQARLASLDQLAAEVQQGTALLVEATLLTMGFHEHRGQWRREREQHEDR